MDTGNLEIKPIKVDGWPPDRCLVWDEPFDPGENEPQAKFLAKSVIMVRFY